MEGSLVVVGDGVGGDEDGSVDDEEVGVVLGDAD